MTKKIFFCLTKGCGAILFLGCSVILVGCVSTTPMKFGKTSYQGFEEHDVVSMLNALPLDGKLALVKLHKGKTLRVERFYITADHVYFIDKQSGEEGEVPRNTVNFIVIKDPKNTLVLAGGGLILGGMLMSETSAGRENLYANGSGGIIVSSVGASMAIYGLFGGKKKYSLLTKNPHTVKE